MKIVSLPSPLLKGFNKPSVSYAFITHNSIKVVYRQLNLKLKYLLGVEICPLLQ